MWHATPFNETLRFLGACDPWMHEFDSRPWHFSEFHLKILIYLARMSSILACCIFVDLICFLLDLASVGSTLGVCMFLIFILSAFVILARVGSIPG